MHFQVPGDPHPWPRDAGTASSACAVIVVDMQEDYCSPGYYMDRAGYDTKRLREPVECIQRVLSAARRNGLPVIYTRHGRAPESDGSETIDEEPGMAPAAGPKTAARGETGWQIVPELLPDAYDTVIEKSTCSSVKIENGVFGTMANASAFVDALVAALPDDPEGSAECVRSNRKTGHDTW